MAHPPPQITDEVLGQDSIQDDLFNLDIPVERASRTNLDAVQNHPLNNDPGEIYHNAS
jgi:hypothetical protein